MSHSEAWHVFIEKHMRLLRRYHDGKITRVKYNQLADKIKDEYLAQRVALLDQHAV